MTNETDLAAPLHRRYVPQVAKDGGYPRWISVPTDFPIGSRSFALTVSSEPFKLTGKHGWFVECKCSCGSVDIIRIDHIREKRVKSCGCKIRDWGHGHSRVGCHSPTFRSWIHMRARCLNPNTHEYRLYGARGIGICERWNDFSNFLHDMGERPTGTTLGRIDNSGNYGPSNCRWETPAMQSRNTRRNRLITYQGVTKCVKDWSIVLGIKSLRYRLKKGWPLGRALNYGYPKRT